MFVGKAKGESLEALGKLFLLGMEYAFSNGISSNIKFLNVLVPYIKLLEPVHLRTITEYYDNHIANLDINLDEDEPVDIDSFDLSDVTQIMKDYRATLIGGKIISARAKRLKAAAKHVETTSNSLSVSTGGVNKKQKRVQSIDEAQYEAQEPGLSFTSVTKPKKSASIVGLHLESIRDSEEYDSESDYDDERGGTVKKAKPGGTALKRVRGRSSMPTLSLEEQDEGEEDDEDEEEQKGGTAVKARKGGTAIKRGRGRSSIPIMSLEEQDELEEEAEDEENSESKRPKTSVRNISDDSDSDNDIASWRKSSIRRRR